MKKTALALSLLMAAPAMGGCQEKKERTNETVVDETRTRVSNTQKEGESKKGKSTGMVCKNGKLCTTLENGKEFCTTPFVPCK